MHSVAAEVEVFWVSCAAFTSVTSNIVSSHYPGAWRDDSTTQSKSAGRAGQPRTPGRREPVEPPNNALDDGSMFARSIFRQSIFAPLESPKNISEPSGPTKRLGSRSRRCQYVAGRLNRGLFWNRSAEPCKRAAHDKHIQQYRDQ